MAAKHQRRYTISGAASPRYQLTNAFKNAEKRTTELAAAAPKVDNYDETSRGEAAVARRDIPPSDPAPSSSPPSPPFRPPRFPAARHNPRRGTDRLTNKVNKYFPPPPRG